MTTPSALVVGVSGICGSNLAAELLTRGWNVVGLSRSSPHPDPRVRSLFADLCSAGDVAAVLRDVNVSHVFITAWQRQATEAENVRVNSAMVASVLAAVGGRPALQHVALVTGLKHYLGPFEAYGVGALPVTPFREEQGRLSIANFYYDQEDELFSAARAHGFRWSVHRPHTVIGFALGNAMNMGVTLACYATICKETGAPFHFPGSRTQWESLTDVTDARQLAKHLAWAATAPAVADQAWNIVNGDIFRWKWMWQKLAAYFDVPFVEFDGVVRPLQAQMANAAPVWASLAARHGLVQPDVTRLASWWHTDADLGRPIEVVTDMTKSRVAGFSEYQPSLVSFTRLFDELRAARVIPV